MGRQKKYNTEEERLEARKKSRMQYYQKNKERIAEYYQANKEKIAEYYQANKEKIVEYHKQYYQVNKEKITEQHKQWYETNRETHIGLIKQYRQTPMGRAAYMVNAYKRIDKEMNRGECTLTAKWIVDHIFASKCIYCGEDDWKKLGCDRKDNSLPHTEDNVVCCCVSCNSKRQKKPFEEFLAECKQKNLEDIATS